MAFSIAPEESVSDAIRRVAREEAESAAERLRAAEGDNRDKAVHEARKSVKKMRATIRLVASDLGAAARKDNRRLRDAARLLSGLRDAAAMVETIDALAKAGGAEAFAPARAMFVARTEANSGTELAHAADEIEKVGRHAAKWSLDESGFEAVEPGLRATYRAGRKAMRAAEEDLADEDFHEWRKRVKDHWYHVRLLAARLGRAGAAREKKLRTLSEVLGEEHNLSVIRAALAQHGADAAAMDRLRSRQEELRTQALEAGARLYASPTREFAALIRSWWDAPSTGAERRKSA